MSEKGLPEGAQINATITVHDSCAVRFEKFIHSAARDLIIKKGLIIEEMKHSATKTFCCSEGGSVGFLAPDLAKNWALNRKKEADGRRIITYCAGCANCLSSLTPTSHILDLLFEPEATMAGTVKVSKAPFTYWNRIKLKKRLKNMVNSSITRERTLTAGKEKKKGRILKRILFLVFVVAAIFVIRFTGTTYYPGNELISFLFYR